MVYVQIKNKDKEFGKSMEKKIHYVQPDSCFLHSFFITVVVDI